MPTSISVNIVVLSRNVYFESKYPLNEPIRQDRTVAGMTTLKLLMKFGDNRSHASFSPDIENGCGRSHFVDTSAVFGVFERCADHHVERQSEPDCHKHEDPERPAPSTVDALGR